MKLLYGEYEVDEYSKPPLPDPDTGSPLEISPEILERIDPRGTLPPAVITRRSEEGHDPAIEIRHTYTVANPNDPERPEAYCNVLEAYYDDWRFMDYVSLTEVGNIRGRRGMGLLVYLAAIDDAVSSGDSFTTSPNRLSTHAIGVWDRLVSAGVAESVRPFFTHPTDEAGYTGGLMVVSADTIGKHNSN